MDIIMELVVIMQMLISPHWTLVLKTWICEDKLTIQIARVGLDYTKACYIFVTTKQKYQGTYNDWY